ncbi:MAG: hypothetical protein J0M24_20340 [Verrucomicrobia bacterium]|nr:hypothetical protein [Verrucomicrobiota bacterium]
MNPVPAAIQTLREEIAAALTDTHPNVPWETLSVTLRLGLVHEEGTSPGTARWRLCRPGESAAHSVSLDLHPKSTVPAAPHPTSASARPPTDPANPPPATSETSVLFKADLTEPEPDPAELMFRQCVEVFGPPGFDNSARAEVFSECLADLALADTATVLEWCRTGTRPPAGHPLQLKYGLLHRVLHSAPAGETKAAEILQTILQEHSWNDLVELLRERWRFGTHWHLPGVPPT